MSDEYSIVNDGSSGFNIFLSTLSSSNSSSNLLQSPKLPSYSSRVKVNPSKTQRESSSQIVQACGAFGVVNYKAALCDASQCSEVPKLKINYCNQFKHASQVHVIGSDSSSYIDENQASGSCPIANVALVESNFESDIMEPQRFATSMR